VISPGASIFLHRRYMRTGTAEPQTPGDPR
jgi:hypothetical protein